MKRMLEILTGASVPQPPEDDQLSASDTKDASFDLGTPSDSYNDHLVLAKGSDWKLSSCMDSRLRRGTGADD